jgi:L-ascorbate metabolism protein UlaG (beta-lactamase superfamily)
MDIAWIGHAAFRLRGRDASVVMDPAPSSTGFRLNRPQADVVTVSNGAEAHSWVAGVAGDPRPLTGPGEYEIKNVLVTGVPTPGPTANGGSESAQNVAFIVTIDEIIVAHLGDISGPPSGDALEELNRADILLLPIGGHGHMDVETAIKIMGLLDAKLVIPMLYKAGSATADLDDIESFLKATGATLPEEPENHINLTPRDLPENTTVMVLSPRGEMD